MSFAPVSMEQYLKLQAQLADQQRKLEDQQRKAEDQQRKAEDQQRKAEEQERKAEEETRKRKRAEDQLAQMIYHDRQRANLQQVDLDRIHKNINTHFPGMLSRTDSYSEYLKDTTKSPQQNTCLVDALSSTHDTSTIPVVTHLLTIPMDKWKEAIDTSFAGCGQLQSETILNFNTIRQQEILESFFRPDVLIPVRNDKLDLRFLPIATPSSQAILKLLNSKYEATDREGNCYILLGPSGCGKSRSLFDIGRFRYTIFMECSRQKPQKKEKLITAIDYGFRTMISDIEAFYIKCQDANQPFESFESYCRLRVTIEYLARSVLLYWFLMEAYLRIQQLPVNDVSITNYSPEVFLTYQLYQGKWKISCLLNYFKDFNYDQAHELLGRIHTALFNLIPVVAPSDSMYDPLRTNPRVILAIDEVHVGYKYILSNLFESENTGDGRGISRILLQECNFREPYKEWDVIIAGTSLGVAGIDNINSDFGKEYRARVFAEFSPISNVWETLEKWIDLSGIDRTLFQRLCTNLQGRARMTTTVVEALVLTIGQGKSKTQRLQESMNHSYTIFSKRLMQKLIKGIREAPKKTLLMSMYTSAMMNNGALELKLSVEDSMQDFGANDEDLVELGLCGIRLPNYSSQCAYLTWRLDEPMALATLKKFLSEKQVSDQLPEITMGLRNLETAMTLLGTEFQGKGKMIEPIVISLFRYLFSHSELYQLPWGNTIRKELTNLVYTNPSFSWLRCSWQTPYPQWIVHPENFVEVCSHFPLQWIRPNDSVRPDAILLLPYGSMYVLISVAVACYWQGVPSTKVESQVRSTDPRLFFCSEDGTTVLHPKEYSEWQANIMPSICGVLRIHFNIPRARRKKIIVNNQQYLEQVPTVSYFVEMNSNRSHVLLNIELNQIEEWTRNLSNYAYNIYHVLRWASGSVYLPPNPSVDDDIIDM